MFTVSNSLSFLRFPLAFLFLMENPYLRCLAIILAMITDSIDGYLARRSRSVTQFGAILDPVADKFFVYFALICLFAEGRILFWHAIAMITRDAVVCIYGLSMLMTGKVRKIVIRSIIAGKITTALQFIVLICLVFHVSFPSSVYSIFILMGGIALIELFQSSGRFEAPCKINVHHDR
jgi:CDP-diacylglycerol--glycerol-3-phosphate 3-phosphatidyltransferase